MLEKRPRAIELVARGIAGHDSVPLASNAIVHLADAVARTSNDTPPSRSPTSRGIFRSGLVGGSEQELAEAADAG
jgi:hypothetical protein